MFPAASPTFIPAHAPRIKSCGRTLNNSVRRVVHFSSDCPVCCGQRQAFRGSLHSFRKDRPVTIAEIVGFDSIHIFLRGRLFIGIVHDKALK